MLLILIDEFEVLVIIFCLRHDCNTLSWEARPVTIFIIVEMSSRLRLIYEVT